MSKSRQQGVALIMALIMLLVITVLGVSSVRMSNIDTQISGNSMYASMVFQGAESALGRAKADLFNTVSAAKFRGTTIDATSNPNLSTVEVVMEGATLESSGSVVFQRALEEGEGPLNNSADDTEFKYQAFQVNGSSRLTATSARDAHTEGVVIKSAPQF